MYVGDVSSSYMEIEHNLLKSPLQIYIRCNDVPVTVKEILIMENEKKFNAYIFYRPKQGKFYGEHSEKPFGVIYKITNKTNGLVYIGQTRNFTRRM